MSALHIPRAAAPTSGRATDVRHRGSDRSGRTSDPLPPGSIQAMASGHRTTAARTRTASWSGPAWRWPRAGSASSAWPTAGSRSPTRTAPSPSSSTASCSTTRRCGPSSKAAAIASRTHCDTELIPHLWEDHGEGMFEHLRGQFALALWDQRRQRLILARDRFGICPAVLDAQHARRRLAAVRLGDQGPAGLRPGAGPARPARHQPRVHLLRPAGPGDLLRRASSCCLPGHYLRIQLGGPGEPAQVSDHTYWEIDFPDRGPGGPRRRRRDGWSTASRQVLLQAVERRLRADVPVVSYLSGGVDSSTGGRPGQPRPRRRRSRRFTIRIKDPGARRDERGRHRRPAHRRRADRGRLRRRRRC